MKEAATIPAKARVDAPAVVNVDAMTQYLVARYGLVLGRQELAEVLQFPTADAFDRSFQRGHLQMSALRFPGRRGIYVLAEEVARYLARVQEKEPA